MNESKIESILISRICPVCGKEFYPAPMHVYKAGEKLVCSYSCMLKYQSEKKTDRRSKIVGQYNMNGDLIAIYSSVSQAMKSTGIDSSCIAEAARGVVSSASGYIWRYIGDK